MSETLGHKIKDFLFQSPTESTIGLAPSKEHMTKEQALEAVHKSWEHPFGETKAKDPPTDAPALTDDSRTLGEKIKDFLFEAPTEENMGDFPATKEHLTKEQALEAIHKAWDHPLKPQN